MTDRLRRRFTEANNSFSRRRFLATSAAIAGGIGAMSLTGLGAARAATLKTVRFSEAVHNLGYINLYVGMHAGIFKKNALDMQVSAAGGDTQTFAAMLAGQADIAIAYQPSVAAAEAQGAKVVFDFSSYIGPFCNTGIMVLPSTIQKDPEMVQALVTSFEEASRKTYADPAFSKEVARKEFPDLPGDVVDKAIDAELKFLIPAQSVVTKQDQWKNLMEMQVYLGNAKGSIPFDQIIDNSFADKAVASLK